MCNIIVINRGEKEIETPRQFKEHFGFEPIRCEYFQTVEPDACLCQIDIATSLKNGDIPFKKDLGDFFVGQLDQVEGDEDRQAKRAKAK